MANHSGWHKRFRPEAELYLKEERVRLVDFSGGTYQFEVVDKVTESKEWPFFQFDEKGEIKDAFCSCEAENGCVHQAAALLKIYDGHSDPLHIRFRGSFWNILCQILSEHIGYAESALVKQKKGHYAFHNKAAIQLRAKNGHGVEGLADLLENRMRDTPENSLKFSNLSQDEVLHWKEGRPNQKLRFELSFWADLAKNWMMRQEEKQPYKAVFTDSPEGFPLFLRLEWRDIEILIILPLQDLPPLIPSLATIHSNLTVQSGQKKTLEKVEYDPAAKRFRISYLREEAKQDVPNGIEIDGWRYVAGKGFYSIEEVPLLFTSEVLEKDIPSFLDKCHKEIAPFLTNCILHEHPISLSYTILFDKEWNLNFRAFLFEKDDLEKPLSAIYGKWAYLHEKGFFPLEDVLFSSITKKISSAEVSHFVNEHRIWLGTQEGFATHLASIEAHLAYVVTSDDKLRFYGRLFSQEGSIDSKDFGDWIYFEKLGFFSKKYARLGVGVRPGIEVGGDAVSHFIRTYQEELEAIPQFFTSVFPIAKRGLKVELCGPYAISITPEFELFAEHKEEKVRFFGDYLYVEGKGFTELPPKMRLPEDYQEKTILSASKVEQFLEDGLEKLHSFITHLDPRLKKPHQCALQANYLARNPEGGLKAQLFYLTEIGKVAVTDIQEAMLKKKRYLFSEAGRLDLREDRFQWVHRLKLPAYAESKTLELPTLEFLRLEAVEGILSPIDASSFAESTRSLLKELREFTVVQKPSPSKLKSDLRQYQASGLYWLWFLYQNGLSGLLCDEMGLGKTHQAMALIASCLEQKGKPMRFLVVCPTSVIYHWQDKLSAFLPSLKVHTFHGVKRSLDKLPKDCVLLTSYGILRVEKEALKEISFEIAVFDEIQNAKNPHSRIHNALMMMQAKMKVGLTGTPIENNLRELKSLFDIVLPGYMPGEAHFREFFMQPIEKGGNEERKALLSQMIRPFILRRRKREVLQELPEKSEDKSYCELSEEQLQLYNQILEKSRETVLAELRNNQAPIPFLHIFSVLSTLKQICNHPALAAKDPSNYARYQSGKWDLFIELLEETRESQQKVVVFSQYLQMLDIIENYVKEKGWGYAQIRGDTLNRREQLQKFQEDPTCVIFLGTLQAAGVGIDLTAASVVILYDRWWNAARENQAIDRVHRIGQKWGVQVYKLITKGTIEEKIDNMITKKGRLLEEVIASDDQGDLKKFTRAELIELLNPMNS